MRTTEEQTAEILNRLTSYKIKKKRRQKCILSLTAAIFLCTASLGVIRSQSNKSPSAACSDDASTSKKGVTLSTVELPSASTTLVSDMAGLVVYGGQVYTEGQQIICSRKEKDALVGAFLGTATGSIDEWTNHTNPEEYQKDFSSTFGGDIYTVNGYDNSFRLCTFYEENGAFIINMLDNLDGITLENGKDLLSERLALQKDYKSMSYCAYQEQYDGMESDFKTATISKTDQTVSSFLKALNEAPFQSDEAFADADKSNLKQYWLCFNLKDGTSENFIVYENGYVKYNGFLDPVYLKASGDTFDRFFQLLCSPSK